MDSNVEEMKRGGERKRSIKYTKKVA